MVVSTRQARWGVASWALLVACVQAQVLTPANSDMPLLIQAPMLLKLEPAAASIQTLIPVEAQAASRGAPDASPRQDLLGLYQRAWRQDAVLRAARARHEADRERLPQAESQRRPAVGLSANASRNRLRSEASNLLGEPVTSHEMYNSSGLVLSLRQPLYRRQIDAQIEQARAQVLEADANLAKEVQNLAVRLTGSYFEALLALDQLALVEVQSRAYHTQLDAARRAFAAGAGIRTDIDEAQARVDLATAQLLEARQHQETTRRQLEVLIGEPLGRLAALDVDRFAPRDPDPLALEDWLSRAEAHSPELKALRAQQAATRQELRRAQAGHLPTVDLTAQWSRSDRENVTRTNSGYTNTTLGVQLAVPLYSGGLVDSQVRQAMSEIDRADEALEATRRDLLVRVQREHRAITEGVLKIRAYQQAVRSADQVVLSSKRSFAAGTRTRVDILNAEQQRMLALRDLAQARYQYLVAWVRLQALSGTADEALLSSVNQWLVP